MNDTAFVFFDEYGDAGLNPTASEWLILSAAVQRASKIDAVRACYSDFKSTFGRSQNWYFHFKKQDHRARLAFIRHMAPAGYAFASTAVHKRSLARPANFRHRYYLYHYALRLTLERVTFYARRERLKIGGIFLSARGGLSVDAVEDYLRRLRRRPDRGYLDWQVLAGCQIHVEKNESRIGLQMADLMASSFGHAISFDDYGVTEPRYLLSLKDGIYQNKGGVLGRGLKFFPELPDGLRDEERFSWLASLAANQPDNQIAA